MAISLSDCKDTIRKYSDPNYSDFLSYCTSESLSIGLWSELIQKTFISVTPPSTSVISASNLFKTLAVGMSNPITGGATFISAFNTAIALIGTGMAPTFIATPPVYSLLTDFSDPSLNIPGVTPEIAATVISSHIVTKAFTGTAFLVPFGPVQPWT